jgi:hypothetical protein
MRLRSAAGPSTPRPSSALELNALRRDSSIVSKEYAGCPKELKADTGRVWYLAGGTRNRERPTQLGSHPGIPGSFADTSAHMGGSNVGPASSFGRNCRPPAFQIFAGLSQRGVFHARILRECKSRSGELIRIGHKKAERSYRKPGKGRPGPILRAVDVSDVMRSKIGMATRAIAPASVRQSVRQRDIACPRAQAHDFGQATPERIA